VSEVDEAIDRLEVRVGLIPGGAFILDAPAEVQAIWGRGQEIAWSKGEPLLIVGGQGAGKSTIAQQLTLARLGLTGDVLGMPVAPSERNVLYLACDRPAQIQRSLRRMIKAEWRDILDERLKVWKGPPAADCARHPRTLLEMAQDADADTVIVDSLKDIALKISDDDVGAGLNKAHQYLVSSDIEYLGLHHQRKSREGKKPTTLEDVYGSTWITAGAGSVVLLWGEPGDSFVELSHLKQPAEPLGPLTVYHDHTHGISTVHGALDLYEYAKQANGITAADVARQLFETNKPIPNQIEKARYKLNKLVPSRLYRREGSRGGQPTTWYPVAQIREPNQKDPEVLINQRGPEQIRLEANPQVSESEG
jgi:replicative DNA helicase